MRASRSDVGLPQETHFPPKIFKRLELPVIENIPDSREGQQTASI
jgi:hypothetical protein